MTARGDRVEFPAAADARVADADPADDQDRDQAGAGAADDVGEHQAPRTGMPASRAASRFPPTA